MTQIPSYDFVQLENDYKFEQTWLEEIVLSLSVVIWIVGLHFIYIYEFLFRKYIRNTNKK